MPGKVEFHFNKPEDSSGYLLWQVTMLWQRKVNRALDKLNLTHTQFALLAALAWLSKSDKTVTQVDIAKYSNTDRMMVSKVLRTLQDKGLITRQEHEKDTRAKSVSLSLSGQNVLQQALKTVEEMDNDFFSVAQAQIKSFNATMLRLMEQNEEK